MLGKKSQQYLEVILLMMAPAESSDMKCIL